MNSLPRNISSLLCLSCLFALTAIVGSYAHADEPAGKTLDPKGKAAQRLEVSNSFGGFRNTLIFYTFKDQQTVLKLMIDNKNKKFPVTGMIYAFADNVTEEDLKKWLNNQHSDGLFPDVPVPVAMHKLPAGSGKVTAHELTGQTKQPFGVFDNYAVKLKVQGAAVPGKFKVKDFEDKATVHLKAN